MKRRKAMKRMRKITKTAVSFFLAALTLATSLLTLSSCGDNGGEGEYTYNAYTTALGSNWNPHTWEVNADRQILDYISSPLVDISILNSREGVYQWVYEMAESVADVTRDCKDDLTRYNVNLPEGKDTASVDSGYVFEIKLNKKAKWQNGEDITADDYIDSMKLLLEPERKNYRANLYISGESALAGAYGYYYSDKDETEGEDAPVFFVLDNSDLQTKVDNFDAVGLYKVDDYTIRYVTESQIDFNYFMTSLTSNWLVHKKTYESLTDSSLSLKTTSYNTSKDSTVSYGPYKIESLQNEKQMVLTRNENWYGYEMEDGKTVSYTSFEVDGERQRQYMTSRIVIDVMDEGTAKSTFLSGGLIEWSPSSDELVSYNLSDRIYKVDETYTMSLFFNTKVDALKKMDASRGTKNAAVVSSYDFRRAFSLAIDREKFCSATAGYKSQFALMSDVYYYDIYNDPTSSYRNSEEGMQAICDLYGIKYGEGSPYADLKSAYASVSGYNLSEARALMKSACTELAASGIYKAGEDIKLLIAWSKGSLSADDNRQITLLESFLNLAAQGSGFGKITLEGVGNLANRYASVPAGEYAIGYGAWGGAAFYPFRNFQVYMDPDKYAIHEGACYDPTTEILTLEIGTEQVSMTWQEWSNSMIGTGVYSDASVEKKLEITAKLDAAFLSKFYRIPLCSTTTATLLSHRADYFTEEYNVMYGFGGMRLMKYHYDDKEWRSYLKKNGTPLNYE